MKLGDSVVVVGNDTGAKVGGVGLLTPAGISSVKRLPSGYVGVGLAGAGEVVDSSICTQFSSAQVRNRGHFHSSALRYKNHSWRNERFWVFHLI
jgi:hypothetical protein